MLRSQRDAIVEFLLEEEGPTAVEYAVMLALIVVVVMGSVSFMAESTKESFLTSGEAIDGAFCELDRRSSRWEPSMHFNKDSVLLRQQLLIDEHVQGSLLRRTALYSGACAVYFIVILVFTESMSNPDEPLSAGIWRCLDEAIYWAPGLMLLSPVIAYDMLKVTNRFAGPFFRLRREMTRLIAGESIEPLSFRDGDYWVEVADIFNELRDELMELREENARLVRQNGSNGKAVIAPQPKLFTDDEDDQTSADEFLAELGELAGSKASRLPDRNLAVDRSY